MRRLGPQVPAAYGLFAVVAMLALAPSNRALERIRFQQGPGCSISGRVTAGHARLPGVVLTADVEAGATLATSTSLDGSYALPIPGAGRYRLTAELAGFAPVVKEVEVGAACRASADLVMTLASRAANTSPRAVQPPAVPRGAPGARFQPVAPVAGELASRQGQEAGVVTAEDSQAVLAQLSLPPGFSLDTLSESVAAFGSAGRMNDILLFGGGREGMFGPDGPPGTAEAGLPPGFEGGLPGTAGPGPGGPGGGRGGGMGPGGGQGPGGGMGGGRGGMGAGGGPGGGGRGGPSLAGRLALAEQNNRPRVQVSYNLGGSALDARPYSLTGQPTTKPEYLQQRIQASVGGPLKIPKVLDAGPRTTFFLNYSGNHSSNLYDRYSTVPTAAARAGDFSSLGAPLIDPSTGAAFAGNRIPTDRLSPAALALLQFYPLPNQPGDRQNYHYATTSGTSSDDVNFRLVRTFGAQSRRPGGGRGGRMGPGSGGGGPMGGGANLNVAVRYSRSESSQANPLPTIGGTTSRTGWDLPVGFGFSRWGMSHNVRVQFNASRAETRNGFAFVRDASGEAGIAGVATDPFSWGLPSLSFSSITGLDDVAPSRRRDRTVSVADTAVKIRGRHAIRFGGEFRDQRIESRTDRSANGSFVFTGLYAGGGARVSGFDFADFLLGLAQQASRQYGPGDVRLRSRAWSLFLQDDWRARSNLTFNLGLRYEYQSPYSEEGGGLVTLDVAPDFSAAVPVLAGGTGRFTGAFPSTIVEPDRNNLAPRLGVAWRPATRTMVRGGYGINYASVPYLSLAQRLASQPPFAVTDTVLGTAASPLSLASAFGATPAGTTTNNFAVDRAYRLGYVQIWNADVQREAGRTLSIGAAYTGTRGSQLDIQRAPNRGPAGLRIDDVQPFTWESSGGRSIMHAISLRVRRRQAQGVAGGATYTLSKSMDNASTIGGGAAVVAQNDQDLEAEWGRSSFDQTHRLAADFSCELPFGPNRRWLNREGWAASIVGGWMLSGNVAVTSGRFFTARVLGEAGDVSRGTNGTLRADYTGAPVAIANPTIAQYFNTAAFLVPAPGAFGNAARNTIEGPWNATFNLALMKTVPVRGTRGLSLRILANNVLNRAQFTGLDTVLNSPTFGRVTSVAPMRSVQVNARIMF